MQNFAHLSDDELAAELFACCFDLRRLTARALAYLGEVEERRIDLKSACFSLKDYCRRKLSMSEGQAHRHVTGARLARRFPFLFEKIESGELCLSTLVHIKDFITDDNIHDLVADCAGKTRNQVDRMLGERFGKEPPRYIASAALVPYERELEKMMDRARELFSHAVPDGDPVELAKRAFALLIEHGEKEKRRKAEKRGKTETARPSPAKVTPAKVTKSVPREAIRAMYARYGEECSYVDEKTGECCRSRAFLEIEHIDPRGRGGTHDIENLRPLCRAHNRLLAELVYGRDYVERRIASQRRGRRTSRVRT